MPIMLGSAYGKVVIDSSGVKSGVDGANKSLRGLESNTKSLSGGLMKSWAQVGLVIGAVTMAVGTMKKAFEFAQEGAKVAQMGESFTTMLAAMGAAPDLLQQLQDASMGTVDNMSLMASTSMMLAGTQGELGAALADAAPELLEMANVAQKLNPTLGDTTFLYDSLARGIKRGSPLILDNLGILVKVEDANKKYAESLGLVADELTAEQQKIALLNAVLEQKEILMKQAGGSADSMTDSYERLNAEIKNQTDEMKIMMHDALIPVVDWIYKVISANRQMGESFEEDTEGLVYTTQSYEDYVNQIVDAYAAIYKTDKKTVEAAKHRIEEGRGVSELAVDYGGLTEAEWRGLRAAEEIGDYMDGPLRNAMHAAGEATQELAASEELARQKAEELKLEQERLKAELEDLQLFISGPIGGEYDSFIEKQGELGEETARLTAEIAALEGLKYLTKDQKAELEGLREELGKNNEAIQGNVEAHDRATKEIVFDLLTQRAAMNDLTEDEMGMLMKIALQWGLVDQATYDATMGIDQAWQDLAKGESAADVAYDINRIMLRAKDAQGATETAADGMNSAYEELANGEGFKAMDVKMSRLEGQVAAIEGSHDVRFNLSVRGEVPKIGGSAGKIERLEEEEGGATGLENFMVPAGYPNDDYLLGLTSGERVTVERPGVAEMNDRTGGISVSVDVQAAVASDVDIYRLADTVAAMVVEKILRANV